MDLDLEQSDSEGAIDIELELPSDFYKPYELHAALAKLCRVCIPSKDKDGNGKHNENDGHGDNDNDNDNDDDDSIQDSQVDTILQCLPPDELLSAERKGQFQPTNYNDRMTILFKVLATLCDPFTMPNFTLSLDKTADIALGSIIPLYANAAPMDPSCDFNLAYDIATIVEKILHVLNADDESVLNTVVNDDEHWHLHFFKWKPHNSISNAINIASDFHHLMLLYAIVVVSLLMIQKLFKRFQNICLNPFLKLYLQIWKNMTKIIYFGIEIDRRDEENGFQGYPDLIRFIVKGSSAIRSIISLILNNDFEKRLHDLNHESLLSFLHPYGRKFRNGSIVVDLRVFVAALIALGSDLEDITDLLFNFEPEDEFDEDIKYMFEMELADYEIDDDDIYHQKHMEKVRNYIFTHDCNCNLNEDDDGYDDGNGNGNENDSENENDKGNAAQTSKFEIPLDLDFPSPNEHTETAIDSSGNIMELPPDEIMNKAYEAMRSIAAMKFETDSQGRDWRDIPRGLNAELNDDFIKQLENSKNDSSIFYTPIDHLIDHLNKLVDTSKESPTSTPTPPTAPEFNKIVRSIAWVVRYEFESSRMSSEERKVKSNVNINSDAIYEWIKKSNNFETLMLAYPELAKSIMDEMLMVEGYRRVLIWFLTHLTLNRWIIEYFNELLIGQRGQSSLNKFNFSRKGSIILSEMEIKMLLHEFFSNAVIYLSRGSSFEFEDLMIDSAGADSQLHSLKTASNQISIDSENSKFITNRSNAQQLIKLICLMLKSLESNNVLKVNDPEYRMEIQTLLIQWVGLGVVSEATELFQEAGKEWLPPVQQPLLATPTQLKSLPSNAAEAGADANSNTNTESKNVNLETGTSTVSVSLAAEATSNPALTATSTKISLPSTYLSKVQSMEGLCLHKLFESTLTPDTPETLTTILHLGAHFNSKHEEIITFMKDLNSIEKVYADGDADGSGDGDSDGDKIESICNLVFGELNKGIECGDDEFIVEVLFASGIVRNARVGMVRHVVKGYLLGGYSIGLGDDEEAGGDAYEDGNSNSNSKETPSNAGSKSSASASAGSSKKSKKKKKRKV